jgi:predicted signal transduction protein with EAL and GGDEF domain
MTASFSPPRIHRIRKPFFLLLSLLLSLLIGWIDFQPELKVMLPVFYLIPITLAAWYVNEAAGVAVSLLCAAFAAYTTEIEPGLLSASPWIGVWGIASRLIFFLFVVWLLGRQRRTMDSIRYLATTDGLTGVYNTRTFFDMLQSEMARSRRYNRPLSLIFLDIDNFKSVNDSFGHQTGDSVLAAVAVHDSTPGER